MCFFHFSLFIFNALICFVTKVQSILDMRDRKNFCAEETVSNNSNDFQSKIILKTFACKRCRSKGFSLITVTRD